MASPESRESSPSGQWTLVNEDGEEEGQDDGNSSSGSSEFVHVSQQAVAYHHLRREDSSSSDTDVSVVSSLSDGGEQDAAQEQDVRDSVGDPDAPLDLRIPSNVPTTAEQEPAAFPLHMMQVLHNLDGSSGPQVETTSGPSLTSIPTSSDSSSADITSTNSSDSSTSDDSTDSTGTEITSRITGTSQDGPALVKNPIQGDPGGVTMATCVELRADFGDEVISGENGDPVEGAVGCPDLDNMNTSASYGRTSSQEGSIKLQLILRPRSLSTSDSESDFAHVDPDSEDDETADMVADVPVPPVEPVAPSVDQAFRFVVANERDVTVDDDDEDNVLDISTELGTEDDRIESDQSDGLPGQVDDDDDEDLSYSHAGIENLPLHEENLIRQYVHRPNKGLSGTLSLLVIMAGWLALGLGIGHSLGSSRETGYSLTYLNRFQHFQTDLYHCVQKKETLLKYLNAQGAHWKTMTANQETDIQKCHQQIESLQSNTTSLNEKIQKLHERNFDLETEGAHWKTMAASQESDIQKCHQQIESSQSDTASLSEEIQKLHERNFDLETEVAQLRQERIQPVPEGDSNETVDETVDEDDVFVTSEEFEEEPDSLEHDRLIVENSQEKLSGEDDVLVDVPEDLSEISGSSEEYENETGKLRRELHLANSRAEMWQSLYLTEQQQRQYAQEENLKSNFTPNVLSCLSLFRPRVNFSQIVHLVNHTVIKGMTQFQNLTNLTRYLEESWEHMKTTSASEFQTVFKEFQMVFNEIIELWVGWGNKSQERAYEEPACGQGDRKHDHFRRESHHSEGQGHHDFWSRSVKEFLNKTQQSVTKVSKEIQEKWKRVKNLSEDLWKKHEPTIYKWHHDFSQGFAKISSKLTEKIQRKAKTWFRGKKQWKEEKKRWKKNKRSNKEEKYSRKSKHGSSDVHGKRHGKNKNSDYQQQQRKYHNKNKCKGEHCDMKHNDEMQKVLQKLHNRIRKISFEDFTRMSRGEIEEVYEDLLDFQDDFGTKFHQKDTEGWLNCQVSWWKAHYHGNKFLMKRCTQYLEQWQVEVGRAYAENQAEKTER